MSVTTLKNKIRHILGDNSSSTSDIFTYENSNIFTLSESNIISVDNVFRNNVEMGTSELIFDVDTNKVTISFGLTVGDTIEIKYSYYPNYSDSELLNYIKAALVQLSINNYGTLKEFDYDTDSASIQPEMTGREENLLAAITAILINPDNRSYRLPDITINTPNDLPTNVKITKTINIFRRNQSGVFEVL